ncbi:MAG: KUP/HAK/KT family potassium transporter [Cytophagales bacterium]|jgi:KUP system potassium uptake protein|nr:KUP/HAK/KT family potassium transporter [Cytophagales bacterium]MCA6368413.1 KUP/HAK/KT family potassium transporter [Cytophagales bacterium]MCA6371572.1 KUP/HAK/KT family potassium transporter [Cytophagales bacterium]MCA6377492.1 KUP/HAK/KT family potassium transporter [Cytophagales bacterium]MCA6385967.1 KUP/HAK/KT family potassium transporter [Cytophagales bacterium]
MDSQSRKHTLSAAGVLVAMGIIYGDIGTSPIYTLRFVVGSRLVSEELILGGLSLVFWTLTIITTIKYVYMALSADNKGEGGIFALYALVRRYKAGWVIFPAILGCCTLIADGFMTPAMSVTSAVEGIKTLMPEISDQTIITIVIIILVALFIFQQFGSSVVGKTFGPVMMVWFVFIGAIGAYHLSFNLAVLKAINPSYGVSLLIKYPGGFWILGAIFLCTTGAEAMYSDLGHCGKSNIRLGWGFVKLCLLLSYFGQGAWLLSTYEGKELGDTIPFFSMMPDWLLIFGVIIATMATVIASQALISGTFTLVNEAMKLKLWPATRVRYPSQMKGQIYIPAINWILMFGCILVVIFFKKSDDMQAAYGLAITVNMLMTSALLVYYFATVKKSTIRSSVLALVFFSIEGAFLISNLSKFSHGGWFSGSIALAFFLMMFILLRARELRDRHTEFVDLKHYVPMIQDLQADASIPREATNLVYMAVADSKRYIDSNIIYSIFKKRPKKADVYWFVHVDTVDSPYSSKYSVDTIVPKKCFFVRIKLGFKADHRVNLLFAKILHDMAENAEIDLVSHYDSLRKHSMPADFKFVMLHSLASVDSEISTFDNVIIQGYRFIKKHSLSTEEMYGLELANVEVETVPIMVGPAAKVRIKREKEELEREKELKYHGHIN